MPHCKQKDKYLHADLFDLDHTLLKGNSSFHFGIYLFQNGLLSIAHLFYLIGAYSLHKIGLFSLRRIHSVTFKKLFQGRLKSVFQEQVSKFLDLHLDALLYAPAIQQLKLAQEASHFVAILSSSPDFLVEPIAHRLKIPHFLASKYAIDQELRFLEISLLVQGEEKAAWVANIVSSLNIDLNNTRGYTDSFLDLPFLLSVGTKICVNPDKKLRRMCLQNGWRIL